MTTLARLLAFFALEGASVGAAVWLVLARPLPAFFADNQLPARERTHLVATMAAFALAALALAALLVWRRGAAFVLGTARRCLPLALAALVPLLLRVELWRGRELIFLTLAATFGLLLQAALRVALEPPLRLPAWRLPRQWPLVIVSIAAVGYAF